RLAGTVGADDGVDLARLEIERDVADGEEPAEALGEAGDGEDRRTHGGPSGRDEDSGSGLRLEPGLGGPPPRFRPQSGELEGDTAPLPGLLGFVTTLRCHLGCRHAKDADEEQRCPANFIVADLIGGLVRMRAVGTRHRAPVIVADRASIWNYSWTQISQHKRF